LSSYLIFDADLKKFIGEDSMKYYSQIKDAGISLFFKGHFHAFNYYNENFLINLNYGGIYWLAPKAIYRVGQIDMENYPKKLLNQKLFIEDKDNEQLIFFALVKRLTQDKPFPKIKVLTDSEFNDLFKHVLDN